MAILGGSSGLFSTWPRRHVSLLLVVVARSWIYVSSLLIVVVFLDN
jgi:hypothetical protein